MARSDKYIKDGQFTGAFDYLVTESMGSWKVPGLSVAAIQDEEVCAKVSRRFLRMNWCGLTVNRLMEFVK
jgi:hypothetical protein